MVDVLKRGTAAELREELLDLVTRDLLGPKGGPEEELEGRTSPSRWYLVGFLAPANQLVPPNEDEAMGDRDPAETEDGHAEPTNLQATTLRPSSFGLSFSVDKNVGEISVVASWGSYERVESDVLTAENGNPLRVWRRSQHRYQIAVPLTVGGTRTLVVSEFTPNIFLRVQTRLVGDSKVVSLFLVNGQTEPTQSRDEAWLFQAELQLSATDDTPIFQERKLLSEKGNLSDGYWNEVRTQAMRYRNCGEYAAGHGVAVHVTREGVLATRLTTQAIPSFEVASQSQPTEQEAPELARLTLDMEKLAAIPDGQFAKTLEPLILAYETWVLEQDKTIKGGLLEEYQQQADAALYDCMKAQERLREGLAVLDNNPLAARAFRFANQAMARQRVRSIYAQDTRRGVKQEIEKLDRPENRSWRLFQLAFFLLNIPALADPTHPTRSDPDHHLVDLLWFPTGGGKTEAYLGITAFILGYRRLQGKVGSYDGQHGVAVLMRYTLRLLTLQQFQRATALICACEDIRREAADQKSNPWGNEPFRIGLWVGQKTTPNRTEDAEEAVRESRGGSYAGRTGKPLQLTSCPWCGTKIEEGKHVEVESYNKGRARTIVYCGDSMGDCLFSKRRSKGEGLPVLTVDEEIYRRLPSLLISTVDKFAQMPWRGETQMLFGRVNGRCPRHGFRSPDLRDEDSHKAKDGNPSVRTQAAGPLRPPDLIIQDELHLISGPLGTLVGLYECAVDELCSWEMGGKPVKPKIIASTATVRQAAEQVQGVFARQVQIFPPPGINSADNFFSRQRPTTDSPGRIYMGICAPGSSIKGALIRVYSAFLSAAQVLYERVGSDADAWMTLVGYFSSIRELGSMRRSCDDSVRSWARKYSTRGLVNRNVSGVTELTSRVSSGDIPQILDDLEVVFDPRTEEARKADWKADRKSAHRKPIDILLATNMLSVGVDVSRLGLMVVAGQPKNTAEYIQATSRVGRDTRRAPGIVCTVYNWARPRDLSHYEKFEHFHATFYQHVEALSVTPFASRALDRGLTSVLCSLARLYSTTYNANEAAQTFQPDDAEFQKLVEALRRRVERVDKLGAAEELAEQIRLRCERWRAKITSLADGTRLGYRGRNDGLTVGLLSEPDGLHWDDWTTLNSLRNVEPMVGLILSGDGIGGSDE